ncbi:MAG: DUF2079 domain-containing protein [Bacteroidetes bacterium]|jgi:uncharacterized membrane protein|nr:DUF2079 domain-containing protein [Bacteroidota bacterium]
MLFDPLSRLANVRSDRLAWTCGALFAAVTFMMATVRYAGLHTTLYDLGVFEHFAYRALHGDMSVLIAAWSEPIPYTHVQPVFALHVLAYAAIPSPLTLVALQCLTLALAFPLIERITSKLAPAPAPHLLPVLLLASGPMWFQALFDFHTDHVAIPAALLAIWGILERRVGRMIAGAMLMALTKENFMITAALLAWVGAARQRSWPLGAFGALLFATGAWVIMRHLPAVTPAGAPALPAFEHLGRNGQEILSNLISQPTMFFSALDAAKVRYLVLIFLPALGLAFLGWDLLIPAAFTLTFVLLSTNPSHSCTCTQYTAGVLPFVLAATALGWSRFAGWAPEKLARRVPLALTLATMLVFIVDSPSPVGRQFLMNKGLFGWGRYTEGWRLNDAAVVAAAIPTGATLSVQNSVNASVFVRRPHVLPFPTGLLDPAPFSGQKAEFAVIDTTRDAFVVDRVDPDAYAEAVVRLRAAGTRVAASGTLELYRLK